MGLQAYVLLGSGIPNGFSAYVLVKEIENKTVKYFVWDPTTGQKYGVDDSFCPLQKVYCVINDVNVRSLLFFFLSKRDKFHMGACV